MSSDTTPRRVLVVDDDAAITQMYQDLLRDQYEVHTAANCAGAMDIMDRFAGDVHVFVVDFGLPDGDGSDFVRSSAGKYGARPTMYVSGWTDEFWQFEDLPGPWIVVRKPVAVKKLLAAVRWLADGGPRPPELDEP